jgi:hypothetical protein
VNVTGSGAGYASAQSLKADETVWVYNCPKSTCLVQSQTEAGDSLPANGSSAWSYQLAIPPNGALGSPAAKQPPTVRGRVKVYSGTTLIGEVDTWLEPLWTALNYEFTNEPINRQGSKVLSCNNGSHVCKSWGTPGGQSKTVRYKLDASLNNAQGVNIVADIKNTILPAWSQSAAHSPILQWCGALCESYHVIVTLNPPSDLNGNAGLAHTVGTNTAPSTMVSGWIKLRNDKVYDHSCGTTDNGCTLGAPGTFEARTLISHELGHTLGLGHCDLNHGVMCSTTSKVINGHLQRGTYGTAYWTPQAREVRALQAIYP